MLFDPFQKFVSRQIAFDFATEFWEREAYYKLRENIFCDEQKIFSHSDIDAIDTAAIPIIATGTYMGMRDQVVGVVRIHEESTGTWYGSRLGVHTEYRSLRGFQSQHLFNNNIEVIPYTITVGAGLIFKAVSSAKAMGCEKFYANVQHQNVNFFERLHWKSLRQVMLHGYLHHFMEADLLFYQESDYVEKLSRSTA